MARAFWLLLLTGLIGCGGTQAEPASATFDGEYPIRVVVTTGMVGDLVRNVGGRHVNVDQLMGERVDPHFYSPTRDDRKRLLAADIIFYSGLRLEGRMSEVLQQVGRQRPVHAVTTSLDAEYLREPPEARGHPDPHVWMDVAAWSQCAEAVADALAQFDPKHADDYRQNLADYQRQLAELDEYVRGVIASIPQSQRVLVTAHDAFGYFSRAYDIPVEPIQGISTESEAGVHDINRLVSHLVQQEVPAIFVESSVSEKNIQAVIEGAASKGRKVQVGGELFSDAMGPPGTYEGTYIGMIDHNATTVARALGGEAPQRGMQGRLGF